MNSFVISTAQKGTEKHRATMNQINGQNHSLSESGSGGRGIYGTAKHVKLLKYVKSNRLEMSTISWQPSFEMTENIFSRIERRRITSQKQTRNSIRFKSSNKGREMMNIQIIMHNDRINDEAIQNRRNQNFRNTFQ